MTVTVTRPGYVPEQQELDPAIPEELAELEKQFAQHKEAGMMAVSVSGKKRTQMTSVKDIDTEAQEIIFSAPLVGG